MVLGVVLAGYVLSFVILSGLGRPNGYGYRLGAMQIFEGAEGVVVFVAMDLVTYRPGLIQSPRIVRSPVRLYRIDVGRDGTVTRLILKPPAGKSHLLFIEPILKLPEGLYLLETPSLGHSFSQLHRVHGERIEPLSVEESESVLRSLGYAGGGDEETDRITERNGWRLLDRSRDGFGRFQVEVISPRHQLRLRFVNGDAVDTMIAEISGQGEPWTEELLTVKTQKWWSYRYPLRPE